MMVLLAGMAAAADPVLLTVGPAPSAPAGVTITWTIDGGSATFDLVNAGPATVQVDWNGSVFVTPAGEAVGVAPGSQLIKDVHSLIPPSVAPPGTHVHELVVREDRVTLFPAEVAPLVDLAVEVGRTVAVDLDLVVGADHTRYRQSFTAELNPAWVAEQDALKAGACAAERADLARRARKSMVLGATVGGGLLLMGTVFMSTAIAETAAGPTDGSQFGPGVVFLVGGAGTFIPLYMHSRAVAERSRLIRCE